MSWRRPVAGDVGDVETQPLPILQRVGEEEQSPHFLSLQKLSRTQAQ
jgi:hypothetical protein